MSWNDVIIECHGMSWNEYPYMPPTFLGIIENYKKVLEIIFELMCENHKLCRHHISFQKESFKAIEMKNFVGY